MPCVLDRTKNLSAVMALRYRNQRGGRVLPALLSLHPRSLAMKASSIVDFTMTEARIIFLLLCANGYEKLSPRQ